MGLLEEIKTVGAPTIEGLIRDAREEGLHLEFKTLADRSGAGLNKENRKTIAKAICGFANAEGGLLLVGIESTKVDQIDVAAASKPLQNVESVRSRILSWIPELLSPQHTGIEVHAIPTVNKGEGFIAIDIPKSNARPHMSVPHHSYFRRGSDGTRVMEHGEIRDLMLAAREAVLSLNHRFIKTMSSGAIFSFDFAISLRNDGQVAVRAPYVRVEGQLALPFHENDAAFTRRTHPNGSSGIYANGGVILHVEDELQIAKIRTGIHLHFDRFGHPENIEHIRKQNNPTFFSIRPYHESRDRGVQMSDQLIDVEISYGAENAQNRRVRLAFVKWELFELMASQIT